MSSVRSVKQLTENEHLNLYELEAVKRDGSTFSYYAASRAKKSETMRLVDGHGDPDGVTIFGLYGEKQDKVILVRQYRYPVGDYIYEFPAGLVEQGENFKKAAVREMQEETGLVFTPVDVDPLFERPFFSSAGMTDETCCMVYGHCTGNIQTSGLEDTEDLSVVAADRDMIREILEKRLVSMSAAYHLMYFLYHEKPFAFLGA